ncbi:ImmA/IrrE family metallo-endopeptidase [Ligilactobacillus equi]|uniref:Prophage Lp2 protein 8 n=1 Tax=Ligilactobacillus equi DPC 6820 TaxID=1392007 RepID=V7HWS1_9LACO|nr:ImmA/IrrE family metallo-endopeptidase [Ligilactobacillus equi]ETA73471.1 prophage Lp2 protein 8 [Ligilactobacillus equi DPC 6820]
MKKLVEKLGKKYKTFNPFTIAEEMGIPIEWANVELPLGKRVTFPGSDLVVIVLSDKLLYSNYRYFVLAHELGHVIRHEDLDGAYQMYKGNMEQQANRFADLLCLEFFREQENRDPVSIGELSEYGVPIAEFDYFESMVIGEKIRKKSSAM